MNSWNEVILDNITSRIGDGLHGTPQYDINGEYHFINGNNLKNGRIEINSKTKSVNREVAEKHKKPLSDKTILISINGTIGNVAYYNGEKCMLGKSACYINLNEDVNTDYMYYIFCDKQFQFYLEMIATGTTIPNVPLKGIRKYTFNLPPLPEQKAIAEVLSSLDDKIDLLHRQNQTLEAMAETLFRQWFVEEADESWEEKPLSEIAKFKNGKKRPKEDGSIPIYGGNGILGYGNDFNADHKSIVIGRVGAYCGSLYFENQKIWISDNAILAKGKDDDYIYFLFYFLKIQSLNDLAEGSSHPLLTQTLLNTIEFLSPPKEKILKFNNQVNSITAKKDSNKSQIQTLTKLRDTLLPKLMSGEVRVNMKESMSA
jgi:type I restriction enzyme S subunit